MSTRKQLWQSNFFVLTWGCITISLKISIERRRYLVYELQAHNYVLSNMVRMQLQQIWTFLFINNSNKDDIDIMYPSPIIWMPVSDSFRFVYVTMLIHQTEREKNCHRCSFCRRLKSHFQLSSNLPFLLCCFRLFGYVTLKSRWKSR